MTGPDDPARSPDPSQPQREGQAKPRAPRVFTTDDPRIAAAKPRTSPAADPAAARTGKPAADPTDAAGSAAADRTAPSDPSAEAPPRPKSRSVFHIPLPTAAGVTSGVRFGALFVSAAVALATLAASISFLNFVSVALERRDWVGWLAAGLLAVVAISGLVLIGREVLGLLRLSRLGNLRRDFDRALDARDGQAERDGLVRLKALYATRPELRWPLARLAEHERDVHDAGALARLSDRELMAPLDAEARRIIMRSAKRVATVSALSPLALITVGYVLTENVGLLRRLAALYGGRPGTLGSLRLARMVVTHIIGTGGVALTDDLIGQFFGQDILRRLSARLGEGAFNAALTARLGAAAVEVVRPLPYLEATPVRARDIVAEFLKSEPKPDQDAKGNKDAKAKPGATNEGT